MKYTESKCTVKLQKSKQKNLSVVKMELDNFILAFLLNYIINLRKKLVESVPRQFILLYRKARVSDCPIEDNTCR